MVKIKGNVLVLPGTVSADEILHARYAMLSVEEMANHVFEDMGQEVTEKLKGVSIIIGGKNFGCGTGRESSARAVKAAGFKAIIADSFARIFFRNAVNQGIFVIECPGIEGKFKYGDWVEIDIERGTIKDFEGNEIKFTPLPNMVKDIVLSGGIINYGKKIDSIKG